MRRREFITIVGGAIAWPLAARAQQPGELPTIGYMGQGTPAAEAKRVAAFVGRLRELSWIEGRTVAIDYRWTEGRSDLAADIAGEFARRKVDIIVTSGTPLITAAKQVTASIPIVFTAAGDPVGSGLVASLARPGGKCRRNESSIRHCEASGSRRRYNPFVTFHRCKCEAGG
jgi:ABC transporter substrate binding protein